jgi:hypothetical protein
MNDKVSVRRKVCLLIILVFFTNTVTNALGNSGNSPRDIVLHYAISAELSFATCMFITIEKPEMPLAYKYIIGATAATAAGFAKELLDTGEDKFDPADIGWDVLGVGTGILLHWIIVDRVSKKASLSLTLNNKGFSAGFILDLDN